MPPSADTGPQSAPASDRRSLAWALFAAGAVLVAIQIAWSMTRTVDSLDDGVQLTMALALAHGQVPNVDVYSVYPPLNAYLLYGAFRLLGQSAVVYLLVQTLAGLIVYLALWTASGGSSTLRRAGLAFAIALLSARLMGLQSVTALMWSTLIITALLAANRSIGRAAVLWRILAGLALGALALTRLNFALYLLATIAMDALMELLGRDGRASARALALELLLVLLPAAAFVATFFYLWGGSVSSLLYQIVVVTSRSLVYNIVTPVPGLRTLLDLGTVLSSGILAVTIPMGWLAIRGREAVGPAVYKRLACSAIAAGLLALVLGHWRPLLLPVICIPCLAAVFYARIRFSFLGRAEAFALTLFTFQIHYTLSRPDTPHFLALLPAAALCMLIVAPTVPSGTLLRLGVMLGAFFAPFAASSVHRTFPGPSVLAQLPALSRTRDGLDSGICTGACAGLYPNPDERAAAAFIRAQTSNNDFIFSGTIDQHAYPYNDVRAYWLCDRPIGTRYPIIQKGVSTSRDAETEIVHDLKARDVRWIFFMDPATGDHMLHPLASVLDEFILQQFSRAQTFGQFEVWQRTPK